LIAKTKVLDHIGTSGGNGSRAAGDSCHKGGKSGLIRRLLDHPIRFPAQRLHRIYMLRAMLQNLVKIFRAGELLPQKRFPINPDNRKLRNASNHIYRHIVKLFVGFLSHVLSTPIRRIVLNAHGICSFICSMDNMRTIPHSP
jgi:signal transduction histidine kinase